MGCVKSTLFPIQTNTAKCLAHLQNVDMLLREMLSKYGRQLEEVERDVRQAVAKNANKTALLSLMRRRKLLLYYMYQCRSKIDVITQKQFSLEQLTITAMQIKAMKDTSTVFKKFTKVHNIEKIEQLQENMEDFQEQIMEIDETLGSEPMTFDDDELLEELNTMDNSSAIVSTVTFPMVPEYIETAVPENSEKIALLA